MARGIRIRIGTTSHWVYIHEELKLNERSELTWLVVYMCDNLENVTRR